MNRQFKSSQEMVDEWEKKQELKSTPKLILNRIRTPDGTILTSYGVHDYVTHTDSNGYEYMVDGGLDYLRRNVNDIAYEELSVTDDAPFKQIRESLHWGTYGKKGDQPLKYVPICNMTKDHLQAVICQKMLKNILKNTKGGWVLTYLQKELAYRKENNITMPDDFT